MLIGINNGLSRSSQQQGQQGREGGVGGSWGVSMEILGKRCFLLSLTVFSLCFFVLVSFPFHIVRSSNNVNVWSTLRSWAWSAPSAAAAAPSGEASAISGLVCYTNLFMRNILKSCLRCSVRWDRQTAQTDGLSWTELNWTGQRRPKNNAAKTLIRGSLLARANSSSSRGSSGSRGSDEQRDPLFAPVDHELFRILL